MDLSDSIEKLLYSLCFANIVLFSCLVIVLCSLCPFTPTFDSPSWVDFSLMIHYVVFDTFRRTERERERERNKPKNDNVRKECDDNMGSGIKDRKNKTETNR